MAEFADADELLAAARRVREAGYQRAEAYSPFHVDGLAEALGFTRNRVPAFTFVGGVLGGAGGFFLQWYSAVIDFPVNVAGRPLNSWPMFIPVTFEMAVLGAAFAALISMLAANGLPRLRHPLFAVAEFDLATRNRFFLCLRCDDPAFEPQRARELLQAMHPMRCVEVPA
ncbi:DUF3341 domain-containing protein [Ramlibacter humi]|uniref:DUF3341 domain-containing protein n=1 Tax=Ramlibacter humi TaxID=2530451 RepID=A0A4Z0BGG0_9BURK|nr:DUF3341 domain-containing protein [Ramlibacter humi]